MEAYAIASVTCAACLVALFVVVAFYARSNRRNRSLANLLSAEKNSLSELISENLSLSERLTRLLGIEIEHFTLRREFARTESAVQHLARVEAGLRTEVARLHDRLATANAELAELRLAAGPSAYFPAEQDLRKSA